ncbi:hypothetical protein F2Q69_00036880 [Brassica cretica]|uniref:Uncharacterized protein n=1 Tax=Brassica cretica TaxID=69181 RepID=A0A8S9SNN8_BRACR|nr:hypothetical protein F2Q69_00036880 [Brassica cretica]
MYTARSQRSDQALTEARSLRSDPAHTRLGRYVATELSPKLGRYVAVGVGNGYDEVNVQLPEEENLETFFDKYFFKIDSSLRKALRRKRESLDKSSKRVATQQPNVCSTRSLHSNRARAKVRSLHSDRTSVPLGRFKQKLGRYVATALEPKLGHYVATKLFRNVDTTLVHEFSSTLRCYLPKTIANPFMFPAILSYQSKFTVKTAESSFVIERSRNKRFESEDGPKGPKT